MRDKRKEAFIAEQATDTYAKIKRNNIISLKSAVTHHMKLSLVKILKGVKSLIVGVVGLVLQITILILRPILVPMTVYLELKSRRALANKFKKGL